MCWTQIHSLLQAQTEAHTHSLLSAPSPASCATESNGETLFNPGKQKVTLFFCGCPLTSCPLPGLHRARRFHRMAQRLTTLWICRDLCRPQAVLKRLHSNLMSEMTWHLLNTHTNPLALGCVALGSLWDRSCERHMWGCTSRLPSAAGLCRPVQLWLPALASCAALLPTASIHTTPAAGSQSNIETH